MEQGPGSGAVRSPEQIAVDVAIRLAMLGVFVALSVAMIWPFLPILIWTAILVVAQYPVFDWLRRRLGGRERVAAVILTGFGLLLIFGPIAFLGANLAGSLEGLAKRISDGTLHLPKPPESLLTLPYIGDELHRVLMLGRTNLSELFSSYGKDLVGPGRWALKGLLRVTESVVSVAVAVVAAGFLFSSAPRLLGFFHDLVARIVGVRGREFVFLAGNTIRNVSRGIIGIAVLQALVVGIVLIVANVPHAGLLAFAVLVLVTLQIGSSPVTLPIMIWAWMTKDTGSAILLTLFLFASGGIDNILKPIVMGQGLRTPMIVIFMGVIGGALVYGLPGLFVGPIVLAVFMELVVLWVWRDGPEQVASDPAEH